MTWLSRALDSQGSQEASFLQAALATVGEAAGATAATGAAGAAGVTGGDRVETVEASREPPSPERPQDKVAADPALQAQVQEARVAAHLGAKGKAATQQAPGVEPTAQGPATGEPTSMQLVGRHQDGILVELDTEASREQAARWVFADGQVPPGVSFERDAADPRRWKAGVTGIGGLATLRTEVSNAVIAAGVPHSSSTDGPRVPYVSRQVSDEVIAGRHPEGTTQHGDTYLWVEYDRAGGKTKIEVWQKYPEDIEFYRQHSPSEAEAQERLATFKQLNKDMHDLMCPADPSRHEALPPEEARAKLLEINHKVLVGMLGAIGTAFVLNTPQHATLAGIGHAGHKLEEAIAHTHGGE